PRLDAYFASPLALCARRVSSAASRLLGSTSLRFALHGWQRLQAAHLFAHQPAHFQYPFLQLAHVLVVSLQDMSLMEGRIMFHYHYP
ncbi:hypothetical protein, partial [Thiolapillus sp.]